MIMGDNVVLDTTFEDAVGQVKAAFAEQGFGILTEIDVQATMKAKLDKDMDHYLILGACNPHLASRAIDAQPQIGTLLPCNVVLRDGVNGVIVEAMDPGIMVKLIDNETVAGVAAEARELIGKALATLTA